MHELATSGGQMASVEASEAETRSALAELSEVLRGSVEIACVNTPKQTVVSGDGVGVEAVVRHFDGQGRKSSRLSVSHAFHSAHMDGMLEAFRTVAERLVYQPPTLTVVSNVTGQVADLDRGDLVTADYWVRHVRQAVRFAEGVHSAVKAGARTFLECGPHGVLCRHVGRVCVPRRSGRRGDAANLCAEVTRSQRPLSARWADCTCTGTGSTGT